MAQLTTAADPTTSPSAPRVITVDKHAAYPKAEAFLKATGIFPTFVELRQVKYLNNIVEQDHWFIKRLIKPGLGFFSVVTVGRTLQGDEVMHIIRKGQVRGVWTKETSVGRLPSLPAYLELQPKSNIRREAACP